MSSYVTCKMLVSLYGRDGDMATGRRHGEMETGKGGGGIGSWRKGEQSRDGEAGGGEVETGRGQRLIG